MIESNEEYSMISMPDDGTNEVECTTENGTNSTLQVCKYNNSLSKQDTETFMHIDTMISVTLTVQLSTCIHTASNGTMETTESQNAYITRRKNTYNTTYTYRH